mgnify:FL=1
MAKARFSPEMGCGKYGISYRDLEEMILERGVEVDHSTFYRWFKGIRHEMGTRNGKGSSMVQGGVLHPFMATISWRPFHGE